MEEDFSEKQKGYSTAGVFIFIGSHICPGLKGEISCLVIFFFF